MSSPPLPTDAQPLSLSLPHKPSAPASCHFIKSSSSNNILVAFLNGLGLPQAHWWPVITKYISENQNHPAFLTYDRYGQGLTTATDPQDDENTSVPPGQRHDIVSVANDLHVLLKTVAESHHTTELEKTPLILVANSIGCALARYYAQLHPGSVAGLILLDSYMTDTTFTDLYPDPDAPGFDPESLPSGMTVDDIRAAREGMGKIFHPTVANKEGFWRGNITSLLGHSYEPKLIGLDGKGGPWLTVVGHDWEVFTQESLRMPGMTRGAVMEYANPAWKKYNEGLLNITDEDKGKGMIAEGAGHFVQQGRPDLVAEELKRVVELVTKEL